MYRILHLADLHLDRVFAGMGCGPELARRRRRGLRELLQRAGETALAQGCSLLTIGGDLYEDERVGADTGHFLAETFASWRRLRVAISPGNHDPFQRGSLYSRTEWPDNVHVFTEPQFRPLELGQGLTLWGLAHPDPAWTIDPLATAPPHLAGDDGIHLALFHGAELGSRPEGKSIHGPFRAEMVAARGFALALCGHYHRRRLDTELGVVYPGTPEPLAFDEDGDRGAVLVEVDDHGSVDLTPITLNTWHAVTARCDLAGAQTTTAVADRACAAALAATAALDLDHALLRLDLQGDVSSSLSIDTADLATHVREATGLALVRVRDFTELEVDIARAAADRTARGAFTRSALAAMDAADPTQAAVLADALRYGLQALSGAEVGLR